MTSEMPSTKRREGAAWLHRVVAVHVTTIATAAGSQLMKLLLAACREEDLPQVARIPNKDGYNPVHIAKAHGPI